MTVLKCQAKFGSMLLFSNHSFQSILPQLKYFDVVRLKVDPNSGNPQLCNYKI